MHILIYVLVAVVGFEREFVSVNEDAGSFQWCVHIFTSASLLPANTEFSLNLFSVAGSAGNTLYACPWHFEFLSSNLCITFSHLIKTQPITVNSPLPTILL